MSGIRPAHTAVFCALALASAGASAMQPNTFEWFPRTPGTLDQAYLLRTTDCLDTRYPIGDATLTPVADQHGTFRLSYETSGVACGVPPPGVFFIAIPIPAAIDGVPVLRLELVTTDFGGEVSEAIIDAPARLGIPPSVAGTWFNPAHADQGLLINVTQNAEAAVSWNTYDAAGNQTWLSGIASIDATDTHLAIALTDTRTGRFAGTPASPDTARAWGAMDIEYLGCGELQATWTPESGTGLQAGTGPLMQLTGAYGQACDLEKWIASEGGVVTYIEVNIVASDD